MKTTLGAAVLLMSGAAAAQELEPRSYSPAPVGASFVVGGLGQSAGPILLDPSLDVDHVQGDLWLAAPGFGHVFGLAGRQARILAIAPIAWGGISGNVRGSAARQHLVGLAAPRFKLSVGLRNAPALTPAEFARTTPRGVVTGFSVTVVPPWGQYEPTQIANLGYNRWAFKPEVGVSDQIGRWTLEAYAGVWLFTNNTLYYPGRARKTQDPVIAWQGHIGYALPYRSWIAFDGTWFTGGRTRVDDVMNLDRQRNSRLGATLSLPMSGRQSLKFVYSAGAWTTRGSAFRTFNVTWQFVGVRKSH